METRPPGNRSPLPDPVPGDGEQLYQVSAAGINDADTHQAVA